MFRKLFFPAPKIIEHPYAVLASQGIDDVDEFTPVGGRQSAISFSLAVHRPIITNQFQTNACVGHGTAGMVGSLLNRITGKRIAISPWWIWWHARKAEGTTHKDIGVQPINLFRTGIKAGFVAADRFDITNKIHGYTATPPIVEEGQVIRFKSFHKLNITDIKSAFMQHLEREKLPIGLTLKIFTSSWNGAGKTGRYAQLKGVSDYQFNHWVYCDGYTSEGAILVNSYGKNWGRGGTCLMPWADLQKLTIEAWSFDPVLL